MEGQQRVIIENVKPQINGGNFPVKRTINESVQVNADIFCDGHDVITAHLLYRHQDDHDWNPVEMDYMINDHWKSKFEVSRLGMYYYSILAWVDRFKSWHRDILKKIEADMAFQVDFLVGAEILKEVLDHHDEMLGEDEEFLKMVMNEFTDESGLPEEKAGVILNRELYNIMVNYPVKKHITHFEKELSVTVDPVKAGFSSWYEVFPRSLSPEPGKHGTFKDVINFLPYVNDMGFDVLYLPPIHPIGEVNRKGKNNNPEAGPDDPGSPWAIGSRHGGHKSIHPELGTLDDFHKLIERAGDKGIDIAMDMAFQCAPDHPYIKEHPEWFSHRPDGTLQYAENPPKKYEDIYPLNFESDDWKNLWEELKSVFLYWIDQGIKIFRVDNPHTKSFKFWGWVIKEIKKEHPDVIFLAEAFTRPKVMYQLAKQGFNQSYTYFTWRNTKYELTKYCNTLVQEDIGEYFRPNFWPNTPDILPEYLQIADRVGYIQRFVLAATLSANYGIYGPAFELMEKSPLEPGREEYLNSEKYEIKQWDFNQSNNLKKIISRVNTVRRENKALQNTWSLKFHEIDNEALICYSKHTEDLDNIILVIVNLDPNYTHSGWIHFPVKTFNINEDTPYQVHDLLSGTYFMWQGEFNYIEINPGVIPVHIFRVRRKVRTEHDFDYFM